MHKLCKYIPEYQIVFSRYFFLSLVTVWLLTGCSGSGTSDPSGEWRMTAVQRQASFGNRADRIEIPADAQIPVYYNLNEDGSFTAESSRRSAAGQWCHDEALRQIVLKSTENNEDTLRISGSDESMKLILTRRTSEGVIEATYSKE